MLPKLMIAATALLLLAAPVSAQDTDNSKAAIEAMSKVTNAKDFVAHAAMSDMFEIQTGQMAQDQGGSDAVKQFGQMLVTDHGSSSRELMDVAKAAGVDTAPPSALDQRHQVIADSLKDAEKSGFDAAFAQAQVQAHQEGIALFEAYARNGDNDQLKAFAQKGLPTLQKHLETAQRISGQ